MTSLTRWYGEATNTVVSTTTDSNPHVMPIIVKQSPDATHEDALLAVARGVALILSDSRWDEQVKQWNSSLYRKISKRAKPAKWDTISTSLEGAVASHGSSEVFVMPPVPLDEVPRDVARLQVSGLDLAKKSHADDVVPSAMTLSVAVNPDLAMTTGKACAQIGHAVHLAVLQSPPAIVSEWEESGLNIMLGPWQENPDVVVKDSGLTEVLPDSITAQAVWRRG